MLPSKSGIIKTNRNYENLVSVFITEFKNGKPLTLVNEVELRRGKFTLRKKREFFTPFSRDFILSEIRGGIFEKEVHYEVKMSIVKQAIFWIATIILIFIIIGCFSSQEYEVGVMVLFFTLFSFLITLFWLRYEIRYLHEQFKKKMYHV